MSVEKYIDLRVLELTPGDKFSAVYIPRRVPTDLNAAAIGRRFEFVYLCELEGCSYGHNSLWSCDDPELESTTIYGDDLHFILPFPQSNVPQT